LVLGMSIDSARETAARYQYQALEFKETAHRSDGVFLPREPGLPVYFLKLQLETVIIYKLSRLSREEIQAMLQIPDIRESRLYQEIKDEVIAGERQRTLRAISKLAALNLSAVK